MSVVVHHLNTSRSERIPWLLEELGVPYTMQVHYREGGRAPASLKSVSPLGKAPAVLVDGELYTESGAVVHALNARFGDNSKVEQPAGQDSVYWSHFSEGSLLGPLQASIILNAAAPLVEAQMGEEQKAGAEGLRKWHAGFVKDTTEAHLAEVERFLAKHEYFSGTATPGEGDIMMAWVLVTIFPEGRPGNFTAGPATQAYLSRVRARPAYQRAMQRIADEEKKQASKL